MYFVSKCPVLHLKFKEIRGPGSKNPHLASTRNFSKLWAQQISDKNKEKFGGTFRQRSGTEGKGESEGTGVCTFFLRMFPSDR